MVHGVLTNASFPNPTDTLPRAFRDPRHLVVQWLSSDVTVCLLWVSGQCLPQIGQLHIVRLAPHGDLMIFNWRLLRG